MTPDYDAITFETWRLKGEEDFTAASILAEQVSTSFAGEHRSESISLMCCSKTVLHPTIHSCSSWTTLFLKRYYIASRYPDDLPEDVRPEEVSEAMKAASHLHDFVLAQVKRHDATTGDDVQITASDSSRLPHLPSFPHCAFPKSCCAILASGTPGALFSAARRVGSPRLSPVFR